MNKDKYSKNITEDSLFGGNLSCFQPRSGYRFSVDSILLAHFPEIRRNENILDLGTGCGVVPLILCYRYRKLEIRVTGIENQQDLFHLAKKNSSENKFSEIFTVIKNDICAVRDYVRPEGYSLVISNPPFYNRGRGRLSKNEARASARHQVETTLENFVSAASYCVGNRCRVSMIYPAEQVSQIMSLFQEYRLAVKKIRFVYSFNNTIKPAKLVMIEGVKNGGEGAVVMPPCYVYKRAGSDAYTKEMEKFYLP